MTLRRRAGVALALLAACGPGPIEGVKTEQGALVTAPRLTVQAARLGLAVSAAAAANFNGVIYLAGGLKGGGVTAVTWPSDSNATACVDTVSAFDPATGQLADVGRLPVRNRGLGLVAAGAELFSVMGYCGTTPTEEASVYAVRDGGSALTGSMPAGSYYFASGVLRLDSPIIVTAGGYGSGPERDQIQAFDPGSGVARTLSVTLPQPRPLVAGATSGNLLYVFGGSSTGTPPLVSATNPLSDDVVAIGLSPERATVVAHLPAPIAGSCAVGLSDGRVLLFGGASYRSEGDGGLRLTPTDGILEFNPATGTTTALPITLPQARVGLACAALDDDHVYLFGGAGPTFAATDEVWQVEPRAPVVEEPATQQALRLKLAGCAAGPGAPALLLALWLVARRRRG